MNYKNGPISGCTTINFQKKLEDFFSNWKTSFSITYREKLESGPATIAIFPVDVLAILKNTYYVCYTNPQKDTINSIIRTGLHLLLHRICPPVLIILPPTPDSDFVIGILQKN
jgi:hypothetical protein